MSRLRFWEKPGCAGNAKQKAVLREAGHSLEVRDLLREGWSRERLLEFLAPLAVEDWFNRAAPRVKSGEVVPEALSAADALELLLAEPLLIRRPLMEREDGERMVGFDSERADAWIGLAPGAARLGEGCAAAAGEPCAVEEGGR